MNKLLKNISIILINLVLIIFLISGTVFGTLIDEFDKSIDASGADELKTKGGKIVGTIQVVGTIVAVGMLGILGIKYMLGSAEQKAEYKKTMIPYIIGTVLIFGFSNITQIIYQVVDNKSAKPNQYCIECGKKEIHTPDSDSTCLDCIIAALERRISTRNNSALLHSMRKKV